MLTGRETLATIEGTIAKLHSEENRVDSALKSAGAEAERLRGERTEALKELARIKLDEMTAGRLARNLNSAERRALDIMEDARHRLAAITELRQAAVSETQAAEGERHRAGEAVEQALAAVEALRAEVEAKVQVTAEWQAAKASFDAADKIAGEAERKSAQSDAELGAKKRPYDDDPLFSYLWSRGFGTAKYSSGSIVRAVDELVASFVGYHGARANYAMLIEIPLRLSEHARGQRKIAADAHSVLANAEHQAMLAAGLDVKERALAEARYKLAAAEATVEGKRTQLATIEQSRSSLLAEGRIPGYAEALKTIATGDAQDDLDTLYREARRTTTQEDEQIVRRLELIGQRLDALEKEAIELRRSARELTSRRVEVERARDRFRSAGYDHPHATFGNDNEIGRVLAQILEGVVRSGILWDVLREGFRTRPPRSRPDFGAPDFRLPFPLPGGGNTGPAGGGWREPNTRGGWFPEAPSGGSGGGRSNDDFTTGGSF